MLSYLAISYFMLSVCERTIMPVSLVRNTLQIISVPWCESVHRATHIGRCATAVWLLMKWTEKPLHKEKKKKTTFEITECQRRLSSSIFTGVRIWFLSFGYSSLLHSHVFLALPFVLALRPCFTSCFYNILTWHTDPTPCKLSYM